MLVSDFFLSEHTRSPQYSSAPAGQRELPGNDTNLPSPKQFILPTIVPISNQPSLDIRLFDHSKNHSSSLHTQQQGKKINLAGKCLRQSDNPSLAPRAKKRRPTSNPCQDFSILFPPTTSLRLRVDAVAVTLPHRPSGLFPQRHCRSDYIARAVRIKCRRLRHCHYLRIILTTATLIITISIHLVDIGQITTC